MTNSDGSSTQAMNEHHWEINGIGKIKWPSRNSRSHSDTGRTEEIDFKMSLIWHNFTIGREACIRKLFKMILNAHGGMTVSLLIKALQEIKNIPGNCCGNIGKSTSRKFSKRFRIKGNLGLLYCIRSSIAFLRGYWIYEDFFAIWKQNIVWSSYVRDWAAWL